MCEKMQRAMRSMPNLMTLGKDFHTIADLHSSSPVKAQ